MGKQKKFLKGATGIGTILALLSFLLAFLILPYKAILANKYVSYGFLHTILSDFQCAYLTGMLIGILPVILGFFIIKTYSRKDVFFALIIVSATLIVLITFHDPIAGAVYHFLMLGIAQWAVLLLVSAVFVSFIYFFRDLKRMFKLIGAVVLLLLISLNLSILITRTSEDPNILLVVVDTLRADHTAIEGYDAKVTPSLKNELIPDGVSFKNHYSTSPWTLPAIASILTSQYPSTLNIFNLVSVLDNGFITLAELLREEGYLTAGIISHILLKNVYGISQGFQIYNERNISTEYGNHRSISSPGIAADAIRFLEQNQGKKFFLFLHFFDPHYIYLDHDKQMFYEGPFLSRNIKELRDWIREGKYSDRDINYLKYCYDSEIKLTDYYIGRVIATLKKLGLYDNTLIVFTGDHGEEFAERGWLGHSTTLFNEQIKVPLLFKFPHMAQNDLKNMECSDYTSAADIMPTIAAYLKIKNPQVAQGINVFSKDRALQTIFAEIKQKRFGEAIDQVCVIRDGWKLIKDYVHHTFSLFNLKADRKEQVNVMENYRDVGSGLKVKLIKWERQNRIKKSAKQRKSLSEKEMKRLKTLGYL